MHYPLVLTTLCKKNSTRFPNIYLHVGGLLLHLEKLFHLHKGILARLDLRNIKTSKCHQHQGTVSKEEEQNCTQRLYCQSCTRRPQPFFPAVQLPPHHLSPFPACSKARFQYWSPPSWIGLQFSPGCTDTRRPLPTTTLRRLT